MQEDVHDKTDNLAINKDAVADDLVDNAPLQTTKTDPVIAKPMSDKKNHLSAIFPLVRVCNYHSAKERTEVYVQTKAKMVPKAHVNLPVDLVSKNDHSLLISPKS